MTTKKRPRHNLTLLLLVHESSNEESEKKPVMWKTLLFTLIGGSAQLVSQTVANSLSQTGKIDWAHVGTASFVGAITTVAGLWHTKPSQ